KREIERERGVQAYDLRDIEQRRTAAVQQDDRRTGTLVSDTIDDVGRVGRCLRLRAEQRIQKHGHAMTRRGSNRLQALRAHRVVTVEPWMELDASKAILGQTGDLLHDGALVGVPGWVDARDRHETLIRCVRA